MGYIGLEQEFYYYSLIKLNYAFALIKNNVTKRNEQTSAMYGQWITEGKPTLSGFKEFNTLMMKMVEEIIKRNSKEK